ncbi:crossover junction endonuclease MUS81 [Vairimorpha necatrix]|uniref:Crossover junction endonuclease MUS81 n=1 Tax=Vairimorpha necatrix TaxID=6039 RepID=A0AAX4JGK1_9MICR
MLVNKIIITKIKSLLEAATKAKLKSKFIYKKILDEFTKFNKPIISKTQIKNIPNVGTKTLELLCEHIETELKKVTNNLEDLEKYKLFFQVKDYNELKEKFLESEKKNFEESENKKYVEISHFDEDFFISDITGSDIEMVTIDFKKDCLSFSQPNPNLNEDYKVKANKVKLVEDKKNFNNIKNSPLAKKKQLKKYIPGYKTGPYAILKALWLENGISKHKIIQIAKNYSTTEFDLTSRNSAWSGMKTLIDKNFVYKESGSKKYFITEEGLTTANKLFFDTSIIKNTDTEVTLLIDSREIKNRNFRSFFQGYFENTGVNFETRQLEVGDFAWIQNEMICDFIVERKCGSDFVSSITDGRYKEQKNRLRDTGITNIYYLVENLKISDFKNISYETGCQSLTTTKLEGMTVIETDDIKESATVIENIHNRVKNVQDGNYKMSYGSFIEKGSKNKNMSVNKMLFYAFSGIYGINNEKARLLTEHFKTFKNFYTISLSKNLRTELVNSGINLSKRNIDDIIHFMCKDTSN